MDVLDDDSPGWLDECPELRAFLDELVEEHFGRGWSSPDLVIDDPLPSPSEFVKKPFVFEPVQNRELFKTFEMKAYSFCEERDPRFLWVPNDIDFLVRSLDWPFQW